MKFNKNIYKPPNSITMMNKWLELLLGLILLIAPIVLWIINFWGLGSAALIFFKGGLVWAVIMMGVLFIMLGISDLKG